MTNQAQDRAVKLMTDADRESLRDAQQAWSSPEMDSLFAEWNLKKEVLRAYERLRKHGQDPDAALFLALYDWDLVRRPLSDASK